MWTPLAVLVVAGCVVLACWAGWRVLADRPVILRQLWAAAVVEALLLVEVVVGAVLLVRAPEAADPWLFWGYLLTCLVVLPFAAAWAFAERTRWSSVVLLVAASTVAVLQLRLLQIWGTV